jgi:hypothetical protein
MPIMRRLADIETKIERMCRSGRPFGQIEGVIDAAPASDGQKAALWLLAWTYQDARVQRRVAKEALAAAI